MAFLDHHLEERKPDRYGHLPIGGRGGQVSYSLDRRKTFSHFDSFRHFFVFTDLENLSDPGLDFRLVSSFLVTTPDHNLGGSRRLWSSDPGRPICCSLIRPSQTRGPSPRQRNGARLNLATGGEKWNRQAICRRRCPVKIPVNHGDSKDWTHGL